MINDRPATERLAIVRVLYHYWENWEDGEPRGKVLDRECFLLGDKDDAYVGEELDILLSDASYMHQLVTGTKGGVAEKEGSMEIVGVLWKWKDTEADIEPLWRAAHQP